MITIVNDIVAGDVLLWLRGNFNDFFGSIGKGRHLFFRKARLCQLSEGAAIRAGSKMECVELCNFHFCCAFIFCQPMKKFEFLGAFAATRQRLFKTSSTGDENAPFVDTINFEPRAISFHKQFHFWSLLFTEMLFKL